MGELEKVSVLLNKVIKNLLMAIQAHCMTSHNLHTFNHLLTFSPSYLCDVLPP